MYTQSSVQKYLQRSWFFSVCQIELVPETNCTLASSSSAFLFLYCYRIFNFFRYYLKRRKSIPKFSFKIKKTGWLTFWYKTGLQSLFLKNVLWFFNLTSYNLVFPKCLSFVENGVNSLKKSPSAKGTVKMHSFLSR